MNGSTNVERTPPGPRTSCMSLKIELQTVTTFRCITAALHGGWPPQEFAGGARHTNRSRLPRFSPRGLKRALSSRGWASADRRATLKFKWAFCRDSWANGVRILPRSSLRHRPRKTICVNPLLRTKAQSYESIPLPLVRIGIYAIFILGFLLRFLVPSSTVPPIN